MKNGLHCSTIIFVQIFYDHSFGFLEDHFILFNYFIERTLNRLLIPSESSSTLRTFMLLLLYDIKRCAFGTVRMLIQDYFYRTRKNCCCFLTKTDTALSILLIWPWGWSLACFIVNILLFNGCICFNKSLILYSCQRSSTTAVPVSSDSFNPPYGNRIRPFTLDLFHSL